MKGYRSDFDILVIVNESRSARFESWDRATDRLNREPTIGIPVGLIVHSGREVNNARAMHRIGFGSRASQPP